LSWTNAALRNGGARSDPKFAIEFCHRHETVPCRAEEMPLDRDHSSDASDPGILEDLAVGFRRCMHGIPHEQAVRRAKVRASGETRPSRSQGLFAEQTRFFGNRLQSHRLSAVRQPLTPGARGVRQPQMSGLTPIPPILVRQFEQLTWVDPKQVLINLRWLERNLPEHLDEKVRRLRTNKLKELRNINCRNQA